MVLAIIKSSYHPSNFVDDDHSSSSAVSETFNNGPKGVDHPPADLERLPPRLRRRTSCRVKPQEDPEELGQEGVGEDQKGKKKARKFNSDSAGPTVALRVSKRLQELKGCVAAKPKTQIVVEDVLSYVQNQELEIKGTRIVLRKRKRDEEDNENKDIDSSTLARHQVVRLRAKRPNLSTSRR